MHRPIPGFAVAPATPSFQQGAGVQEAAYERCGGNDFGASLAVDAALYSVGN